MKAPKNLKNKPRVDLIPPEVILEEAKVFTFGAEKYEAHSWRLGLPHSVYYSACMRHLLAWMGGEDLDKESKINHLAHAKANLSMLLSNQLGGREELDDRIKEV